MSELDKNLNKIFFIIFFFVLLVGGAGIILAIISNVYTEKPAIVRPDYKDAIAELAFSLQEIKQHINKEHDLKAEMRMECSERLNNMVLQAEKMHRTVPTYKLGVEE